MGITAAPDMIAVCKGISLSKRGASGTCGQPPFGQLEGSTHVAHTGPVCESLAAAYATRSTAQDAELGAVRSFRDTDRDASCKVAPSSN